MNFKGILSSAISKVSGSASSAKKGAIKIAQKNSQTAQVQKTLSGLSTQGKVLASAAKTAQVQKTLSGLSTQGKVLASAAKTTSKDLAACSAQSAYTAQMDKLVEEGLRDGLKPIEAARGAKELIATVGRPTGKRAADSAVTFIKNGLTQAELKLDLLDKHGEKLRAKQAADAASKAAEAFQEKLNTARKYY